MIASLYQSILPAAPDAITISSVDSLNTISHAIEDVARQAAPGATLLAGFQRLSAFARQERRYRALADVCGQIWVHGVADRPPPQIDGVGCVPLAPDEPLAREWFLIVNAPTFGVALIARELPPSPDDSLRRFAAFLTADPAALDTACGLFGTSPTGPYPLPERRDPQQRHANLMHVLRQLIQRQERRAASPSRREPDPAATVLTLQSLLPAFAEHEDWQRLLLANIRQAAAKLDG